MRVHLMSFRASCLAALALQVSLFAQSNSIPGLDVKLSDLSTITALGRQGTYPNGVNGFGGATTSCNVGTVQVDWFEAMDTRHPYIATLMARETNGRLVQICDRSFIKHGFLSTNSNGCGTCQQPGTGTKLGLACSDTYSASLNGDGYYMSPADEVDPWLGAWASQNSYFDRGEPDVGSPANKDGVRSLTRAMVSALGPIAHRMRVLDSDLAVTGSQYYYQGYYVIRGEPDAARNNSFATRQFVPTFNTTTQTWSCAVTGVKTDGSILTRWSGATVTSGGNGNDDGRFYVAVKVTGPVAGRYHYEYAIQNRDNNRAGGAIRIATCRDAQVWNAGFRDVDQVATNDWTFTRTTTELVWSTTTNALRWNSFYNVWFDSDAAPASATLLVDEFATGPGLASVSVTTSAPVELVNLTLGAGCGSPAPALFATGTPARALLGNATFGLQMTGVLPNASCWFFLSGTPGSTALGSGCTSYADLSAPLISIGIVASPTGVATLPMPVPASASLEGTALAAQGCQWNTPSGAWYGYLDFSGGLKVRIGNTLPGCP